MKYVAIVIDGRRKRAVTIEESTDEEARKHLEDFLLFNHWKRGELYKHDGYSPQMEDSYLLEASAVKKGRTVEWNESNPKTI
jgi:hypothetical protein